MSKWKTWGVVAVCAALTLFEAVAPAAAQGWRPPPPPYGGHHGPGWGAPPPPPHWRPRPRRCWIEERRERVMTPWGPRTRIREVRVCR